MRMQRITIVAELRERILILRPMVPSPEEVEGEVLEEDIIEEETTGETETAVEAAAQPVTPAIPSSLRTGKPVELLPGSC